jgi:hypothetical protein
MPLNPFGMYTNLGWIGNPQGGLVPYMTMEEVREQESDEEIKENAEKWVREHFPAADDDTTKQIANMLRAQAYW